MWHALTTDATLTNAELYASALGFFRLEQVPLTDERLDLEEALRRIGAERRRALVLHDLCGLTVAEVAEETGPVRHRWPGSSKGAGGRVVLPWPRARTATAGADDTRPR